MSSAGHAQAKERRLSQTLFIRVKSPMSARNTVTLTRSFGLHPPAASTAVTFWHAISVCSSIERRAALNSSAVSTGPSPTWPAR